MSDAEIPVDQAEQQIAAAIAFLREKMPPNFVLIAMDGGEVVTMGAFSLNSARDMLKTAMEAVAEQYAYDTAKRAVEK